MCFSSVRSPEILLGLVFTEATDIWSLGCMAAGMFRGTMLYPGMSEYEMVGTTLRSIESGFSRFMI